MGTPSRSRDRRRRWILAVAYTALLASCENPLAPEERNVTRVDINPPVLQLVVGGSANLVARVYGDGDVLLPSAKVFWSSQNPAVVTVNQDGVVSALAAGTAQIAASSGGQSRTIAVTVEQRPIALVRVTPSAGSVVVGQTLPLQGEALDGTGGVLPNRPLAWSSDSPAIATVNNFGVVTGVAVGLATISATGEGKTGTAVVTVLPPAVASISVSPDGGTVAAGNTLQLTGTARDAGGQALPDRPLTWQSNNDGVATVSSTGLVTAITPGSVSITASAPGAGPNGTTPSTTVNVLVQPRPVANAVIVPSPASVQVGFVVNLTVNLFDAAGEPLSPAGRTISWSTSNASVATVSLSGSASGVSTGTATITATITTPGQASAVLATVQLTVSNQPVASVVVTPNPATVHAGVPYARNFTAAPLDGTGQPLVGRTVVWTSSNQAVATVDAGSGLVTGVSPGAVQIRATSEGVQGVASVTVDLVPVSTVTVAPPAVTLTPPQQQPLAATPRDSAGNVISGAALGGRTTAWVSNNQAAATVDAAGVVTAVAQGTATVTATIGGTNGQSAITVNSIPIASIVVAPSPQSLTLGTSVVMTATALDALGGVLPGRVFTWASSNPLVASVDQAGLVTTVSVGGPIAITASAEGKVGTAQVTVIPRPASKLGMSTQPSSVAQSGVALGQQPAVQLLDNVNTAVAQAGVVVTASIGSGTGTLGGTVTATTNASGIATFTNLAITGPAGTYTLAFSAPSLAGVASGNVILGAGGASQLAVTTQPSATAVNAVALAQQPAVTLRDASNNPVALAGVDVTASIATGTGTLGGTVVATTDLTGTATFTDLSITGVAGPFTLRFTAPGLSDATSGTVTLGAGAAAALAMVTAPAATAINGALLTTQPAVRLRDSGGNPVASAGVAVTVALTGGPATLGGTLVILTDPSGVATFTDLAITGLAGPYTLDFTSPGLAPVTSTTIALGAGAATQLAVTTQPSASASSGSAFGAQPVIQLRDAQGNAVSQAGVSIAAAITGGGATLTGTTPVTTNASGVATFTDLGITGTIGSYTLTFTSAGLTSATSSAIALGAGAATQLTLTTPPPATATSGEVFTSSTVVQLRDASGNAVPVAGVGVTASIATGSGASLAGTIANTDGTGSATFSGLTLTGTAGAYTLSFGSGALTPVVSGTITLSAGTGSKLSVTTQPSSPTVNSVAFATQPVLQLLDASNNPVAQAGVVVSASIVSVPPGGSGSLGGTLTVATNGSGTATFTNLAITGTAGNYTLLFGAAGFTAVASGTITITPGAAVKLGIGQQPPGTAQSGAAFVAQPSVQLLDVSDNVVPQAGVNVAAAITGGGATLNGTTPVATSASGVATFTDLGMTGPTGNYTLTFTSAGLTSVTSGTVVLSAGAATQLTVTTPPPSSATNGVAFGSAVVIQVNDGAGNPVPQAGVSVAAAITGGGATLNGTTPVGSDASGVATFPDLAITGTAGNYTLTFSSAGLTSATTGTIALGAGAASQLGITTQPSATAASGAAFGTQPVIQLRDAQGNAVSQAGVNVTVAITGGGATLNGTATVATNASGVAAFTNLGITGTAGNYTLTFTSAGLTGTTSGTIALGAGAATQLSITTHPSSNATSGAAFATQPVLQLRDGGGNAVSQAGVNVTAAITGGGATLNGTATVATNASGVATFTDLGIAGTIGSYTLDFTATGMTGTTSTAIALAAGTATQLGITTQPSSSAASGTAFGTQPVLQLRDAQGNAVAQAGVSVAAAVTGGATLIGTTPVTTNASGMATFTDLGISGTVGNYTLTFSSAGLTGATSITIALGAGAAAQLTITTQPSANSASGAAFGTQPVLQLRDAQGNAVAQAGVSVAAAITGGGATLVGTTPVATDASGVATFTDLGISGTAGNYTLAFSSAGLAGATSNSIALGAGAATQLTITTQPSANSASGAAFGTQPVLQLRDAQGNAVNQAGVSVAAAITGGGATLVGTTPMTTNASGVATFTDLGISGTVGNYTLTFSSAGLTSATSNAIAIAAGAATQLSITTQPSGTASSGVGFGTQPVIQLRDGAGNTVSQAGVNVAAAITGGGATLTGTTPIATNASGVATFTDLAITGSAGSYTLDFTSAGLAPATSTTIALGAGAATQLAITTQPSATASSGSAFGAQPVIQLRDAQGNAVSQAGVSIAAAVTGGGAALTGTTPVTTNASGVATFTDLGITGTIGSYTLTFTSAGLTSATSSAIALGAGAATQLTISTQPSANANSGAAFGTQPVIQLRDAQGNAVSQAGVNVAAAVAGATLNGTTPVATNASGVATFTDLGITGLVGNYTLDFSASGLTGATSSTIALAAGAATQLTISAQPSPNATNAQAFGAQPVLQLRDAAGNAVSQAGVNVAAAITGGGATLNGTTPVATDGAGVATFTDLGITGLVGNYTLTFSAAGLTGAVSGTIALAAGAATQLTITTQPSSTAASGVAFAQQPVIQLVDVSGNLVATSGVTVTVALASGTGTLGGTVSVNTDANGVASWATSNDLAITGTGSHTLQFSSGALTPAVSNAIVLP